MQSSKARIDGFAELLDLAAQRRTAVDPITAGVDLTWEDAYRIQDAIRTRQESRGFRCIGYKAGLTSFAKMKQMGIDTPVMGFLMGQKAVPDGGRVDVSTLIHPRVEAEIAFVLKRDLRGPECDVDQVLAATDFILPAVEILDSRYKDFKFDLKSVIADNTSAALFVTGGAGALPESVDLRTIGIVLEKNGEIVATAAGAAVLGNPALSVAMLANMLAKRGQLLPAGSLIMAGGATEAIPVNAGDLISVRCQGLGSLSVRFV